MNKLKRLFAFIIAIIIFSCIFTLGCSPSKQGEQGPSGPQGEQGANGLDGSFWHTGYTVPVNSVGKNGDLYLDVNSRDIYKKENARWILVGNMQGKDVKQKWDDDGSLKILGIGNSFTEDAFWYLPYILNSLGITDFHVSFLFYGGRALSDCLSTIQNNISDFYYFDFVNGGWTQSAQNNYDIINTVKSDSWDYITLQQASGYSGLAETYSPLPTLIDEIEQLKPDAKIIWHMTWAYQQDTTHASFASYNNDQITMYNSIVNATKTQVLTNLDINFIVPNGTVIQNARTSYLGDTLTRDGYHLSFDIGRYMTALTFAHTLTGYDISNVEFAPQGVNQSIKNICIESVLNAVKRPYTITNSTTLQSDFTLLSDYGWTDLAFWNSGDTVYFYQPILDQGNSLLFVCSKMFDKTTLPIGSIIEIDAGWAYRPDGWIGCTPQPPESRPNMCTTFRIVVDETWWGNFDTRAFNVCKADLSSLEGIEDEAKSAFRIYIPNN